MKSTNNILTSPESDNISALMERYNSMHSVKMTKDEFYYFMTIPTSERDVFLHEIKSSPEFDNDIICNKYELEN